MKKLILAVIITAISSTSFGQVSFGLQVGANFAFGKAKFDDSYFGIPATLANDPKVGAMGGLVAEIPIGASLAFRPELNFIQKGSKSTLFSTSENKRTLNYLELPLNVVYKLSLGGGKMFFGLGPSVAFGISGKDKVKDSNNPNDPDYNYTSDIKFDGKKYNEVAITDRDTHLNRFDVGANILAGYQLPMGVFFKIGYTYNFIDVDPNHDVADQDERSSYKNRGFNICVGYMLGGSKAKD